jgi:hypothetical protein
LEKNSYIKESDLKRKEHFPIYVFFNMMSESDFMDACESFSKGIGRGIEFGACLFPDDVDIEADKFDGVEFSLYSGEEVVVDYQTFYYYLSKACECYIKTHQADEEKIEMLLEKIKERFKCKSKSKHGQ